MENLYWKVKVYLESNGKTIDEFKSNILLQNDSDGGGNYIHTWNVSGLAKPTAEQLDAFESEANTFDAEQLVVNARQIAYPSFEEFAEAYCEKEIGEDSTKWDAYVTKYNLVRSNNPKP